MAALPDPEWHPAACLFPMMPDAELRELADDIRANGLRQKIVLLAGKILDGRNRWRACQLAGVEPQFEYANALEIGDPWKFVWSLNGPRRHLSESQRAIVAGKMREHFEREAKQRQRASGGDRKSEKGKRKADGSVPQNSAGPIDARDEAARTVNVSHFSIDAATTVLGKGAPELVTAVETGAVSVSAAAEVASLPAEQQTAIVAEGPKAVVAAAKKRREERKAKAKPRAVKVAATVAPAEAEPWDVALTLGELNSALAEIDHQCPARDVPELVAFLEGWVSRLKERVHVNAA